MSRSKPWLDSVIRVPNARMERHSNKARLDKSERLTRFNDEFFGRFISSITQEDILCYPETSGLVDRLCAHHGLLERNFFLVPGADAAIKAFFESYVSPGGEVIVTTPCFPMYGVYCNLFNAKAALIPYRTRDRLDFDLLLDSIKKETALLALANPNSPIGDFIEIDLLESAVRKCNDYGVPVLIDEAYCEYAPASAIGLIDRYENVAIARTFSKAFGGAGARVGYLAGGERIIKDLSKWRLLYEVNQVGVKFASYMLDNMEEVLDYAEKTKKERELTASLLERAGYDVISSKTNWLHMHGGEENHKVLAVLKKHDVLFKTDSRIPFDHRDWIRLTVGPEVSKAPFMAEILNRSFEGCECGQV